MSIIKNKKELLTHGNIEGREIATDIIEYALKNTNSFGLAKKHFQFDGKTLVIDSLVYDVS